MISVSDSGEGIKPDFLSRVFDRFSQADGSSTRSHGGLGLGLAIVRHLVEMHGGSVRAQSAGEGQGATFVVSLPLFQDADPSVQTINLQGDKPSAASVERSLKSALLDGLRVVVVDDEADFRELVTEMLKRSGAVVKAASSAAEALRYVEDWKPDVLVADIGMREEDGYSMIRKVRELPADRGGGTPALALTAYTRTEDRQRALAAGYQEHLGKPVTASELAMTLTNLTGSTNPTRAEDGESA